MSGLSRRQLLSAAAAAVALGAARRLGGTTLPYPIVRGALEDFDPWLEVDPAAFRHNAAELARLIQGRPIFSVAKNNAYGLGMELVGPILDPLKPIVGLAVVRVDEAIRLRDAGVKKQILLMARCTEDESLELVRRDVALAPFGPDAVEGLARVARRADKQVHAHLYVDTGMNRLGMPYDRALPWIQDLVRRPEIAVDGTFMSFTEDREFDPEQLRRFRALAEQARRAGVGLGPLHAASSHGLFFRRDAYLDLVRPGLALYGAYPAGAAELGLVDLKPVFRLKARVVDVQQLQAGDSASYDRAYTASKPTWIAIIPVGHADGYPRGAVKGCQVLVGEKLYPVIAAVSASHTIIELGDEKSVEVGDVATLVGPDRPEITPNGVAERAGVSVYDILMHLSALLPKRTVGW